MSGLLYFHCGRFFLFLLISTLFFGWSRFLHGDWSIGPSWAIATLVCHICPARFFTAQVAHGFTSDSFRRWSSYQGDFKATRAFKTRLDMSGIL
ncbi:hypothetical protein GUITHDRAFT_152846 [Guillardia theta CCMP2712]|uniref:Uncharacterized protein n=1 Tax=Guillardia theta (strain CCMP2712) TaxID=905079 RepID=L1JAI2_GUITC|nr:hypothetical protein GUITHDRAFT_152846 [Guillardia theta CCMP2712]EKX45105.1 hypothetical protein GUITHDRAFT_152846 [Guillardia theta CCMP2712]|mmetsp:Transcript_38365/g.120809  ORF Transcript_38365/g.120809 Transcript_38365/m.120809 type:complete len:94 (-) Transcript_38365:221-502(-)|eukprot:XP_005832085.1 hypothetical protein GUITHDRAFT_152846 [Guillardia theta CCMP2712]